MTRAADGTSEQTPEPPERLTVTSAALRAMRREGWTVSEQRSPTWLYLVIKKMDRAAVYKLIGPCFDAAGSHYRGERIA